MLQFLARSPGYPLFNNWLIYLQTANGPRPVSWATAQQWERHGRRVRRTARPMLVLTPHLGPVEVVHDVADTTEQFGAAAVTAGFPGQFERREPGRVGWMVDRAVLEAVLPPVAPKQSVEELAGSAPAFLAHARVLATRLLGHTAFSDEASTEMFRDCADDPPPGRCRSVRPEIGFTSREAPTDDCAQRMETESVLFLLSERTRESRADGELHHLAQNVGEQFEQIRLEMVVRVAARLEQWSSASPESVRRRRLRA